MLNKASSQPLNAKRKLDKREIQNDKLNNWYFFDAKDQVLGRMASKIAKILQGKHKPDFVPYRDMADNVVVINAKSIRVSGKKENQKVYTFYSGYPSGLKKKTLREMRAEKPEFLIWHAVTGMLPKNKLAKVRLKKLHIFQGAENPYKDKQFVNA